MKKITNQKNIFFTLRRNSLATEMWLVLFTTLIVFALVFIISARAIMKETRINDQKRESETFINSVSGNIQTEIDKYKELSRLIMLNEEVISFLRVQKVDKGIINDTKYAVMDILNVSDSLDSVFIMRNDGYYASTGRGEYNIDYDLMDSDEWMAPILDRRGGVIVLMNAGGAIHRKNDTQLITIARAIYDIYTQKQTGILLMNISTRMFDHMELSSGNSTICISGEHGEYLAGDNSLNQYFEEAVPKDQILYNDVLGEKKVISYISFNNYPMTIICANYFSTYHLSRTTIAVFLSLLLAFFLSMFASTHFVMTRINKPINELSKAMEKTKESGWIEEIDIDPQNNEIGVLINSYNSMIKYMNDLFTRLIDKEQSIRKSEMRVLYEQIKPHFLYNSLETISFMALDAGNENVYSALETLGSFYRNFLSKGSRVIPFSSEVSIVKDYLLLQKLRYGDIIEDRYDIADNTKDIQIPKLILQPLVENCIYHGIRPKGECCEILISSFLEDDGFHIIVKDTGIGMPEDIIDNILRIEPEASEKEMIKPDSSFGLKGTVERIRYFCNTNDVVYITSEQGEYTLIEIIIPKSVIENGGNR